MYERVRADPGDTPLELNLQHERARRCPGVYASTSLILHGKEGVDGSSPSEESSVWRPRRSSASVGAARKVFTSAAKRLRAPEAACESAQMLGRAFGEAQPTDTSIGGVITSKPFLVFRNRRHLVPSHSDPGLAESDTRRTVSYKSFSLAALTGLAQAPPASTVRRSNRRSAPRAAPGRGGRTRQRRPSDTNPA